MAAFSTLLKSFLFSFSSLWMFPNVFLLHWVNSDPHFSIFFITMFPVWLWHGVLQADSIILPHPSFVSQTSSNWKVLDNGGGSIPLGTIQTCIWSNVEQLRCMTFVSANRCNHSLVQKALSSLSHTDYPSEKCLLHVNFVPENPRSINPQASTASLKSCIWAWPRLLPPNFSSPLINSLKSPAHNQGMLNFLFRFRRRS